MLWLLGFAIRGGVAVGANERHEGPDNRHRYDIDTAETKSYAGPFAAPGKRFARRL
jgi:hypothetical protein